jgi:polyisoprenoid-binding protein YceI
MIVGSLFVAACSNQAGSAPQTSNKPATGGMAGGTGATGVGGGGPVGSASTGAATPNENSVAEARPVPLELGGAKLTPENTKIEFVGTHSGNKPDPRTGGFAKFSGAAEVDSDGKTLKSVSVEIETGSLWTQMPPLTAHLNSPDFFDTREYPAAKFESTQIAADGDAGQVTITGNLTLLAATREVSFPANVTISGEGLTLTAKFSIDRAEFGMDKLVERVEKTVSLTVVIGEKTQPQQGPVGFGGGRGGPGGGRPPGGAPGAASGDGK